MSIKRITRDDDIARTQDSVSDNVRRLAKDFPEAIVDGKVDFEVLRQLLGDDVDLSDERYGLSWSGKRQALAIALAPSTATLRPVAEGSADWGATKNIVIEGDNLEVLKQLQKGYAGRVQLIYIDPPYNTGQDFVYLDNFADGLGNYLRVTGQVDAEGKKLTTNSESSGRFHTAWLNMMFPRLRLAREFLSNDGAIFVSCDEGELMRLRAMMEEIFGAENFIAELVWRAGRKNDSQLVSVSHEYIVCFVRNLSALKADKRRWRQRKKGLDEIHAEYERLRRQHDSDHPAVSAGMKAWFKELPAAHPARDHRHYSSVDARGLYFPDNISWPGGGGPRYEVLHPVTGRPVKIPSRGWMTSSEEKMQEWIDDDRVHFGLDESTVPCIKAYLVDRELETPLSVFYQDGRAASKRLRSLFDGVAVFPFPKDETVLRDIVEFAAPSDAIVMDFFAGSGTTGHAVVAQNAADGGNRRYILVQLPEPLDPANKEQKVAAEFCQELGVPLNIAELTKERLRRAGEKVKAENPDFDGDTGFRVYRLDSSNICEWDPDATDLEGTIEQYIDRIKPDRSDEDLQTEVLLKLGIELTTPIETREIAGKDVSSIGAGALITCFDRQITDDQAEALATGIIAWLDELQAAGDTTIVFRDDAFDGDVAKTNLSEMLVQHGVARENIRSL